MPSAGKPRWPRKFSAWPTGPQMVSGSTATVADGFVESKVALVTARDHDLPGHEGLPRARSIGDASGDVEHRAVVVAIPVHHGTRVRAGVKRRQARLTRA